jgi:predicted ester cyclase
MPKPITHVATTDISDMLAAGTERRMDLPGFDAEFVDFPHYIIRITDRIWHDRDIDLCLLWYTPDCAIHTTGGDIVGAETVVRNTHATLQAFPDRRLDADNVIWSDEGAGHFYSSHLITSKMTNLGVSDFGPATGKSVRVRTIADCLCADNRIYREWLVRDNCGLAQQLGYDPAAIARRQAAGDCAIDFSLVQFHAENRAEVYNAAGAPAVSEASEIAVNALRAIWMSEHANHADVVYDFRVAAHYPGDASLYGPDQIRHWMAPLRAAIPDAVLRVAHIAEIPYLGAARDVAVRWSVAGTHLGDGHYGAATGAPVYIIGVSHFRVMNARVREETTVWDDIAVRRQIETLRQA